MFLVDDGYGILSTGIIEHFTANLTPLSVFDQLDAVFTLSI